MKRRNQSTRLGPRDREILSFIGQQRMSWLEALHRRFYADRRIDAAKSTLRRLCGKPPHHRYLHVEALDCRRVYYRLTVRAAALLGLARDVARPLGRSALIRRYALQWFVYLDRPDSRWQCNPRDFPDLFPLQGHRLPQANFYVEKTGHRDTHLGFAVVDFGSDARRITRRTVELLERFAKHGWFDELIAAEKFDLSMLTLTEGKAKTLEYQLQPAVQKRLGTWLRHVGGNPRNRWPIKTQWLVVPGLLELIPSPTSDHNNKG